MIPPSLETPRPPQTAEFGHVRPGGPAHVYPREDGMTVTKLSVGPFDNNVYLVRDGDSGKTVIIDGPSEPGRIVAAAEGSSVVGILLTHSHPDHVQALPALVEAFGVPVHAHPADSSRVPVPTRPLIGGETIAVGGVEVSVLHTPGHTPGSLCFVARDVLFSGDTLFPAGPGATGGNPSRFAEVMQSLDRLFALPDQTRVCPGHGLDTLIGRERPSLETWRARGW